MWCVVFCVVYDVCVVCGVLCVFLRVWCVVVCDVVCVFLPSVRAGGVLFKTRTQYQGVLGKKNYPSEVSQYCLGSAS